MRARFSMPCGIHWLIRLGSGRAESRIIRGFRWSTLSTVSKLANSVRIENVHFKMQIVLSHGTVASVWFQRRSDLLLNFNYCLHRGGRTGARNDENEALVPLPRRARLCFGAAKGLRRAVRRAPRSAAYIAAEYAADISHNGERLRNFSQIRARTGRQSLIIIFNCSL